MRLQGRLNSKILRGIIWFLIYPLVILPVWGNYTFVAQAAAASDDQGLVQQGIDLYEKKEFAQAEDALKSAELIYPDNYAVPYYLGLIALEKGDRETAIAQWKKYMSMAPQDDTTLTIRKNVSILLQKEAKEYAKKAVMDEAKVLNKPVDENTVAVSALQNLGSDDLGPLGKGMAAMIIADLSQFKELKVVERERLQALLQEMDLGTSGLVDRKTAPKVGKLLRAKYVTSGSMTDLEKEKLQIASVLQDADLNTTKGSQDIEGKLSKFYDLEKKLACSIATDLGQNCEQAPEAFNKIHTKSLPALVAYSHGLDYADEENYDEARTMFQEAVEEDPEFDLAYAALLATPVAAMLLLSEAQMASSAAASAPTASATTTGAAAGASTAGAGTGATATTAAAGGGVGLGTTAAIAGGVVLAGGAAAMAVGAVEDATGDDDDDDPDDNDGQYRGTWTDTEGNSGTVTFNVVIDAASITGDANFNDNDCISNCSLNGSFNGTQVNLDVSSSDVSGTMTGSMNQEAQSIEGTLEITSGQCTGTSLEITASRTGSANVAW
ncbi:MAG: CsgG/HfaB family protein [Desulfobacteraceae bacterium]|jgi:tetratricopeptide (TPR) repeat protein